MLNKNFDEYDNENQKKFLGILNNEINKTYKLLENLLLWSQTQKENIKFSPMKTDLYLLSIESYELLSQTAQNKSIKIINEIPGNFYVNADKDMLLTVFRNLISNAIKYTPRNGEIIIKMV